MCCLTSALKLAEGVPIVLAISLAIFLAIFLAGVFRIMELQEQGYAYVPSWRIAISTGILILFS
jgi:hypothetical protein